VGIDWFDVRFRLERTFESRLRSVDFEHLWAERRVADLTAGELHDLVCALLRAKGRTVPISSWNRVRRELAESLNISPFAIRRSSWLTADLGMD
jgi:hypothetical protein